MSTPYYAVKRWGTEWQAYVDVLALSAGVHPGDYGYGPPDEVHGPFSYPEGCVVFACFRGESAHHEVAGPSARSKS